MRLYFIITFMGYAILRLFRPLEQYAGPSILTVGVLCFVFFLGWILKCSSETACLSFAERDIFTVIWILELYYID
jgi:hypothetical protein